MERAVGMIHFYADRPGYDGDSYDDLKDKEWADKSIIPHSRNFDHILTYYKLLNDKRYNIFDSFLVLEADDSVLRTPPVKNVDEMMITYFSHLLK